jgi:hypothetical protein
MLAGGTQECCNKRKIERGIIFVMLHQQLSCGNDKKHPFPSLSAYTEGGGKENFAHRRGKMHIVALCTQLLGSHTNVANSQRTEREMKAWSLKLLVHETLRY